MKSRNSFFPLLVASLLGGFLSLMGYKFFIEIKPFQTFQGNSNTVFARYSKDSSDIIVPEGMNFIYASDVVRPTVVHIKCTYEGSGDGYSHGGDPFYRFFFDDPNRGGEGNARMGSGSGVIISADGYIVTNHHVIDHASKIEVVLNDKRKYEAKLIGKDPETDLALLKIEEKGLAFSKYGNSDKIRVGEWVLACGNPFDLTSTITAGIVSAKGRNINLLKGNSNYAIESFIQTDAAVNPGNSGGALVNLKGELIGINTAIASTTGAYSGYSFAVPVTLVKKVMDDLLNFGEVQRALLGVMITDVTAELAKEKGLKHYKGVYINSVNDNSAAKDAGLKENDIVLKINDTEVNSASELQESVAQYRPGDKIKVTIIRNNDVKVVPVTLKNKRGTFNVVKEPASKVLEDLGADFTEASNSEKDHLKINSGVRVNRIFSGKLKDAGVKEGFIITKIDKKEVGSVQEMIGVLENKTGGILIEGMYPNGSKSYYALAW